MPDRYRKQDEFRHWTSKPSCFTAQREFSRDATPTTSNMEDSHEAALFDAAGGRRARIGNDASRAETWPTKSLRAIVPVGAGSTTDIIPRVVFEQLSAQLHQSIVVENRVGAGGTIGSAFVAKAEPDGYTILAHGSALTISPALYSQPRLRSGARPCSRNPTRGYSERLGCIPGTRLEDGWRPDSRCQGQTRRTQFLVGRRRQRNPSERRVVPAQRGRGRSPRPVQGRRRSSDRGDCGSHRFLLRAGRACPALYPGRQTARARREWGQAIIRIARCPDNAGIGNRKRRVSDLVWIVSARQDARRDHRNGCTTKPSRRSNLQKFARGWPRSESIRWQCRPPNSPLMCKEKLPETRTW